MKIPDRHINQTFSGRLRERFDEIEDLLRRGVKQTFILELFKEEGFEVTASALRSTIHRIRKETAKSFREPPKKRLKHHRPDAGINRTEKTPKNANIRNPIELKMHDQLHGFSKEDI